MKRPSLFRASLWLTALFSLIFFLLGYLASLQKSFTTDEVPHVAGGYMIWRTGDYRINLEHPPAAKLWATLPLLCFDLTAPTENPDWRGANEWNFGGFFLYWYNDADFIAAVSRFFMLLSGFALGWGVYSWGRRLFAPKSQTAPLAGFFAATLFFTEPNILAHSSLVTYDAAFALVCFYAAYSYWLNLMEEATPRRLAGFVAFMALAPAVKVVGLILWALIAAHLFYAALVKKRSWRFKNFKGGRLALKKRKTRFAAALALIAAWCLLSCFFIWASYGFRFEITPGEKIPPGTQFEKYYAVENITSPLPRAVLSFVKKRRLLPQGYITVVGHAFLENRRVAVLFQRVRLEGGYPSYFVWTTLLKTPLPHLAAILLSLIFLPLLRAVYWKKGRRRFQRRLFYLGRAALPFYLILAFFIIISRSGVNLGHRLILMIIPFQCLLAGNVLEYFVSRLKNAPRRLAGAILPVIFLFPAVNSFPDYISYFNAFVPDKSTAWRYLTDSNLDWGQDCKALGLFAREANVTKMNLSFFGSADPCYHGLRDWIDLGSYTLLIPRGEKGAPDYRLPTAVSLNMLGYAYKNNPELFQGEPRLLGGAILIFPPASLTPPSGSQLDAFRFPMNPSPREAHPAPPGSPR